MHSPLVTFSKNQECSLFNRQYLYVFQGLDCSITLSFFSILGRSYQGLTYPFGETCCCFPVLLLIFLSTTVVCQTEHLTNMFDNNFDHLPGIISS